MKKNSDSFKTLKKFSKNDRKKSNLSTLVMRRKKSEA